MARAAAAFAVAAMTRQFALFWLWMITSVAPLFLVIALILMWR